MLDFFQILMAVYKILKVLVNLFRRQSRESLELLRQMALAREANLQSNVCVGAACA